MAQNKLESPEKEYQTGGWKAHWILIVCASLYMINFMDRTVMTIVVQPMKLELGLSDADLGLLQTVFMVCLALFSFPVAYLIDRWSRKKSIALMAILWSGATFVTGLSRNFIGVLIPRLFVGLGEAGFSSGGTAMVTAAYKPEQRGRIMALFNIALPVGSVLGVILGGVLSARYGWRTPFLFFAIPGVILGIAALFLKDYKTAESDAGQTGIGRGIAELLKTPTLRWFFAGFAAVQILLIAQQAWVPALIMRQYGVKEDVAGGIMGLTVLFSVLSMLMGGFLADKYSWNKRSRMLIPALATFLQAVTMIAGMAVMNLGMVYFIVAAIINSLVGVFMMPALSAVSQEVVRPQYKSLVWGMNIFFMYLLGGAWAPWAVGGISDALGGGAEGLKIALILSTIGGFLATFFFYMGSRTVKADMDRVKDAVLLAEK